MPLLPGDSYEKELTFIQKSEIFNQGLIETTEITAAALKSVAKKFNEVEIRLSKLEQKMATFEHDQQVLLEMQEVLNTLETGG
jgi:hypothetical protein